MTLLADRDVDQAAVHVLIISVGFYDGGTWESLPGAAATATRLAEWWMGDQIHTRFPGGAQVATVDVLASDSGPVEMSDDEGASTTVGQATCEAVHAALRRWTERARDGHGAVLHWIGHGEIQGQSTEGELSALYCRDVAERTGRQEAIAWERTLLGIRTALFDHRAGERVPGTLLLCFMDSCRNPAPDWQHEEYPDVFRRHNWRLGEETTLVFHASGAGKEAYCIRPGLEVCGDFDGGGALFSEAVMLALDRLAARLHSQTVGTAAYADSIRSAANHRINRWRRRVPELGDIRQKARPDTTRWCEENPVMLIPDARGMVDVVLSRTDLMAAATCEVSGPDGPVTPFKQADRWDMDLKHDYHDVTVSFDPPSLAKPSTMLARPWSEYIECRMACGGGEA